MVKMEQQIELIILPILRDSFNGLKNEVIGFRDLSKIIAKAILEEIEVGEEEVLDDWSFIDDEQDFD